MAFDYNGLSFDDPLAAGQAYGENQFSDPGWNNLSGLEGMFSDAGFDGPLMIGGGENSEAEINPELKNWMEQTGNHLGSAAYGHNTDYTLAGLFDGNNKLLGGGLQGWNNGAGPLWDMAVGLASGAVTGGIGGMAGLSGTAAGALSGAAGGGLGAMMTGADPLMGMVTGGVGGGIQGYNPAASMGIENKALGNIANKTLSGAGTALVAGQNPLQGALSGAVNSSVNTGLGLGQSMLSDYANSPSGGKMDFYDGTTGDSAYENPINTGGAYNSPLNAALGMSQAPGFSSSSIPGFTAENAAPQTSGQSYATPNFMAGQDSPVQQQNPIKELMKSIMAPSAGGPPGSGVGSLVSGLAGIYSGYEQRRRAGQLAGQLQSLYSPNSAYAQQLRQTLDRKDAAAGRRSQYGPREVELQARLADLNSRNAPQLQSLYNAQNQGLAQMGRSFVNLGNSTGAFKGMYDYLYGGN